MTDTSANTGAGGRRRASAGTWGKRGETESESDRALERERQRQRELDQTARDIAARERAADEAAGLSTPEATQPAPRKSRGRLRWLLMGLAFVVPLLSAIAGVMLGETLRPPAPAGDGRGSQPNNQTVFAPDYIAPTGRIAVPLDVVSASRGPVLLLEFDVAMTTRDAAIALRDGAGRLRLREEMLAVLTDALNVPMVQMDPTDGRQLAIILSAGLRNRLAGVAGVRINRLELANAVDGNS